MSDKLRDDLDFIKKNYPLKNSQLRDYVSVVIDKKRYGHSEWKLPIEHVHTMAEELRLSRKLIERLEQRLAALSSSGEGG